jgi:CHRD domain
MRLLVGKPCQWRRNAERRTPDQAQQFTDGEWYINVHTQDHQADEIRGQF